MSDATPVKPTKVSELAPGMELQGTVKRIELYGAFVDVGVGSDGLLHISQLGKSKVNNVEDVVKAGDTITVYVLKVETEGGKNRIALSMVKPAAVSWDSLKIGEQIKGTVAKIENFGAFVDIGAERLAMIHVSELAAGFVKSPNDVVQVGQEVTAQIIQVDRKKKRIDLSIKALTAAEESRSVREARQSAAADDEPDVAVPSAMELAYNRAMAESGSSGKEVSRRQRGNDRRGDKRDRRDRDSHDLEDLFERTIRGGNR
jgi:small subunit ribosomal protein S1